MQNGVKFPVILVPLGASLPNILVYVKSNVTNADSPEDNEVTLDVTFKINQMEAFTLLLFWNVGATYGLSIVLPHQLLIAKTFWVEPCLPI